MVVHAWEEGVREIHERDLALEPLLQKVARRAPEKDVDSDEARLAVAAAECVATAAGRPPANPPDALIKWLVAHPEGPPVPLMAAAIKALDRLGPDFDDLRARLHGR